MFLQFLLTRCNSKHIGGTALGRNDREPFHFIIKMGKNGVKASQLQFLGAKSLDYWINQNKFPTLRMKSNINAKLSPAISQGSAFCFRQQLFVSRKTPAHMFCFVFPFLLASFEPDSPFSKMVPAMKDSSESCSALQAYSARAFLPTMLETIRE